jgi:hypothetical protein
MYNLKCYAYYSSLWWNCSRETVNSSAWSFFSFYNLTKYSVRILQYDIAVTAGPSWCLASNHNNTRLAVSMDRMNIRICYCPYAIRILLFACLYSDKLVLVFWKKLFSPYLGFNQWVCFITDTDWRACSWIWQLFALKKDNSLLLVTSDWCIPVKNAHGWSAVMFIACEIIHLFYVVFCVLGGTHKFDFRLVKNVTPYKQWAVKRRFCSDGGSCFWWDLYFFPLIIAVSV